nr:glycerophosphodiester phosphodiesterase family protein [Motiliproteus sediminis]
MIAHRGFSCCYPENTRVAFEAAIDAGATALEGDVQLSADGVPFMFHDRELRRLCGVSGRLEQKSAAELAALSAYAPQAFGRRFEGEPLLPLSALMPMLEMHPHITFYLEVKRVSLRGFSVAQVLDCLWPLIWPRRSQIVLISFSLPVLVQARQRGYPRIAPVLTQWCQLQRQSVVKLAPEAVFLNHQRLPFAACYPDLPYHLALYETSDPMRAIALAERGASLIETDDIGQMLRVLHGG